MSETLPPMQGGCLCGQVRYEATPEHRDGYYCHCRFTYESLCRDWPTLVPTP